MSHAECIGDNNRGFFVAPYQHVRCMDIGPGVLLYLYPIRPRLDMERVGNINIRVRVIPL